MMRTTFFYFLSAASLLSALGVVTARDLFRSAISLIALLLGIAGMYLLLDAQFLSAAQITVYIGGITVLIAYVVLLVADVARKSFRERPRWRKIVAGTLACLLFLLLIAAFGSFTFRAADEPRSASVAEIGKALLSPDRGGYVLAFEIISLVLIAPVVGAITIARSYEADRDFRGGQR